HLAISSWRALIGFSIGGSLGLILGLISGLSRWGERLLDTSIQMLRNVPHLAMNAREFLQTDVVVVAIILYALLGKLADVSAQLLERLWLRWNPAYHLKEATI
nr:hypothetical protein [Shigella flexneri]